MELKYINFFHMCLENSKAFGDMSNVAQMSPCDIGSFLIQKRNKSNTKEGFRDLHTRRIDNGFTCRDG